MLVRLSAASWGGRSPTTTGWMPLGIDQAGHFHRAALGQVGDQAVIGHVAVDLGGPVGFHRLDDRRAVLVAAHWAAARARPSMTSLNSLLHGLGGLLAVAQVTAGAAKIEPVHRPGF